MLGGCTAGVHFEQSTQAAVQLCGPLGRAAYARAKNLLLGQDTGPVNIADFLVNGTL